MNRSRQRLNLFDKDWNRTILQILRGVEANCAPFVHKRWARSVGFRVNFLMRNPFFTSRRTFLPRRKLSVTTRHFPFKFLQFLTYLFGARHTIISIRNRIAFHFNPYRRKGVFGKISRLLDSPSMLTIRQSNKLT